MLHKIHYHVLVCIYDMHTFVFSTAAFDSSGTYTFSFFPCLIITNNHTILPTVVYHRIRYTILQKQGKSRTCLTFSPKYLLVSLQSFYLFRILCIQTILLSIYVSYCFYLKRSGSTNLCHLTLSQTKCFSLFHDLPHILATLMVILRQVYAGLLYLRSLCGLLSRATLLMDVSFQIMIDTAPFCKFYSIYIGFSLVLFSRASLQICSFPSFTVVQENRKYVRFENYDLSQLRILRSVPNKALVILGLTFSSVLSIFGDNTSRVSKCQKPLMKKCL